MTEPGHNGAITSAARMIQYQSHGQGPGIGTAATRRLNIMEKTAVPWIHQLKQSSVTQVSFLVQLFS